MSNNQIIYVYEDIRNVKEGLLGHGVNCQLVMGSGVAKVLRDKYPIIYDSYLKENTKGPHNLGNIQLVKINNKLTVVNMFTQEYYGRESGRIYASLEAIYKCYLRLFGYAKLNNLKVSTVKVGCGLGGLKWSGLGSVINVILEAKNDAEYTEPLYVYVT